MMISMIHLMRLWLCAGCWSVAWASYWQAPPEINNSNNNNNNEASLLDPSRPAWKVATTAAAAASSMVANTAQQLGHSPPPPPPIEPSIDVKEMSLSLRLTCELNRRLQHGTTALEEAGRSKRIPHTIQPERIAQPHPLSLQRGGTSHPVHVHPSLAWQPPIRPFSESMDGLTVFHAKSPRPTKLRARRRPSSPRRGAARWGPELHLYLQHVTTLLGVQDNPVVLALAMMYLDRACSVETPRHNQGSILETATAACPFVTPRTVHRLVLVSLILATKVVQGTSPLYYEQLSNSLGIPRAQLEQMEQWMTSAMGDHGLYVSQAQMMEWMQTWEQTFHKKRPKIRPMTISQQQQQQQEPQQQRMLVRPMSPRPSSMGPEEDSSSGPPSVISDAAMSCWA